MKSLLLILTALILNACENVPQACDIVSDDSWKSYYDPQKGTIGIRNGLNPCNVEVVGEPIDGYVAIGSDQANSVRIVGNEWDAMMFKAERSVNGLHVENDIVKFSVAETHVELGFNGDLKAAVTNYSKRCSTEKFFCGDDAVYSGIRRYPATFARDASIVQGLVFIADTFGHRVAIYNEASGQLIDSFEIYYPNSIQVVGRKIIVAAEHQNQILEIDLDTRSRRVLFGCDLDIYSNPYMMVSDLVAREVAGEVSREDGRSICEGRLYSPNMATLHTDGTLLIADTDNHRVLIVRDGVIKTEIRNLNNPTRATFWRSGKRVAK